MISTHFSNGSGAANDRTDQAVKAYELVREYAGTVPVLRQLANPPAAEFLVGFRAETA